jgi:hypothetical protein
MLRASQISVQGGAGGYEMQAILKLGYRLLDWRSQVWV